MDDLNKAIVSQLQAASVIDSFVNQQAISSDELYEYGRRIGTRVLAESVGHDPGWLLKKSSESVKRQVLGSVLRGLCAGLGLPEDDWDLYL